MSESDGNRWHLKKEFQVGHLISSVTMAVAAILYVTTVERRTSLNEAANLDLKAQIIEIKRVQAERDDRQDRQLKESLDLVRGDINKVTEKLDKMIIDAATRRAGRG